MKVRQLIALLLFSQFALAQPKDIFPTLGTYNIVWHSQSKNSGESMHVGGGDTGLNVWVEDGDLIFYISRSGAFDENNEFLKLGRIRLQPNIFQEANHQFRQELDLKTGAVFITGKSGRDSVNIQLWVDVFNPEIHLEIKGAQPTTATAFYENWRTEDRYKPIDERHSCFSYSGYLGEVATYRDSIYFQDDQVLWHHRNRPDKLLFDFSVAQQGLTAVKDQMTNPQKNLTFGGLMQGTDMATAGTGQGNYDRTPYTWWAIKSKRAAKNHQILIRTNVEQAETLGDWEKPLFDFEQDQNLVQQKEKNLNWWREFWERSHIFINTDKKDTADVGWQVGRNYQLFRYMLACNAYGAYPTKFNGGLFTFAPAFVPMEPPLPDATPDFRKWGGGSFTAQNQRLVYWPMLKSGDFDMMPSQFDFYKRGLKNVELRTQVYWGHGGASFTEHPETFGLPFAGGWGFDKGPRTRDPATPFGEQSNPYVKHHFSSQIDFAFMILQYYQYSGRDIREYLPFVKSALDFFFEHYAYRHQIATGKPYDENGKLVIFPSTAAETYKNVRNPTDICSGLTAAVEGLLTLPDELIDKQEKAMWYGASRPYSRTLLRHQKRQKDTGTRLQPAQGNERRDTGTLPTISLRAVRHRKNRNRFANPHRHLDPGYFFQKPHQLASGRHLLRPHGPDRRSQAHHHPETQKLGPTLPRLLGAGPRLRPRPQLGRLGHDRLAGHGHAGRGRAGFRTSRLAEGLGSRFQTAHAGWTSDLFFFRELGFYFKAFSQPIGSGTSDAFALFPPFLFICGEPSKSEAVPDYSRNSDDDTLWNGIRSGSEVAFELIYDRYFRVLYAYGRSLLTDEEVVRDVIQDLFLEIWRQRLVLSPARSVKYYLLGSLRRRIQRIQKPIDLHRRTLASVPESDLPTQESPEFLFTQAEAEFLQSEKIKHWLDQLPPRQHEALELHFYHNLSYREVATLLDIKEQTARNLVQKALTLLRRFSILLVISFLL